jgi:hypothetical protein
MHDGSIIVAQPGCTRVENGLTTTGLGPAPNDCTSNLQTLNLQMLPNWPPYDGNWPLPATVALPANSIPR